MIFEEEDLDNICQSCNGTGEGETESEVCPICRGSGEKEEPVDRWTMPDYYGEWGC